MEALRRLRRNSSETNVDRRLVTNVLLSFLTTPRADAKRFEMLSLLATILSWSDSEREKAGLQRAQPAPASNASGFWGRSSTSSAPKGPELEKTDETEVCVFFHVSYTVLIFPSLQSFSRLWVEFLLTEAGSGESTVSSPTQRSNTSLPGTPTTHTHSPTQAFSTLGTSYTTPSKNQRRLPSGFNSAAMASTPNLTLDPPPSRKGKEREIALP